MGSVVATPPYFTAVYKEPELCRLICCGDRVYSRHFNIPDDVSPRDAPQRTSDLVRCFYIVVLLPFGTITIVLHTSLTCYKFLLS